VQSVGLIAGDGRLPVLFAQAARAQGLNVYAVAHRLETDPSLEVHVDGLAWVQVGQLGAIVRAMKRFEVTQVALAGGIGRVRSLTQARPDWFMLKALASLRSFRDDEVLRAIARALESQGLTVVSPTAIAPQVLVSAGHWAGPRLSGAQARDVELGVKVATALGAQDVGQTVCVKEGVVLAVEAVEGTDACIRRAGQLTRQFVVVKRAKPGQDERFDLPAVGPVTVEVMREAGAKVLAIHSGKSIVLDGTLLFDWANRLQLSIVAVP
jgi:UDP-2,3-diacylglucosamine hydrolase